MIASGDDENLMKAWCSGEAEEEETNVVVVDTQIDQVWFFRKTKW
jgi:hypothetical protein